MAKEKVFNVLSICGSGTVSSSMVAEKLREKLSEKGVRINAIEARPTEVENYVSRGGIDFIVTTSPLPGKYKVPVINAVGFLTGFDEDGFMDEVMDVISKMQ